MPLQRLFLLYISVSIVTYVSAFDHSSTQNHRRMFADHSLSRRDDCISADPQNTVTDRLNKALTSAGAGFVLSLCPNQTYFITDTIKFTHANQEISTLGYPTDGARATFVVSGPIKNGTGQTTAIDGTCKGCDGIILRNIQVNGTRADGPQIRNGGANIEMGGGNQNQLIEYVRSYYARGWSCLHVTEGSLNCNNVTVQNNDIGPCGVDHFPDWADGISFSCRNGLVRNNLINNPTDGGIVIFGSPGTLVENNTIWIENRTLLGGINMVDYTPWSGNFDGVVVQDNLITGGFATSAPTSAGQQDGENADDVIIKIGIAIGPRTWFGDHFGSNASQGASVINNKFTGAFGFAIAMSSAKNFTVTGNTLVGNTSFIGQRGVNCTSDDQIPPGAPFVVDLNNTQSSTTQPDMTVIADGDNLPCLVAPSSGNWWPYGGNPNDTSMAPPAGVAEPGNTTSGSGSGSSNSTGSGHHSDAGRKAGLAVGIIAGVAAVGLLAWYIRKWALARKGDATLQRNNSGYVRSQDRVDRF